MDHSSRSFICRSFSKPGHSRTRDPLVAMCWVLSPPFCEVTGSPNKDTTDAPMARGGGTCFYTGNTLKTMEPHTYYRTLIYI